MLLHSDAVDTAHGEKDELVKNANNRELQEGLMSGDNAAKIQVLKRKYEQLIEDFEHQFTGTFCIVRHVLLGPD